MSVKTGQIVVVAVMETTNFTLTACGRTHAEAGDAIARAWRAHSESVGPLEPPAGSSADLLEEEWGIRYIAMPYGGFHIY